MSISLDVMNYLIESLKIFVPVFGGAYFAFYIENKRRIREEIKKYCTSADIAMITIYNMWNILVDYEISVIDKYRNLDDVWLNLPVQSKFHIGEATFKLIELSFLIEKGCPNVLTNLMLEEQRFWELVNLIENRNNLVLGEVHSRMSEKGVKPGFGRTSDEFEKILGYEVIHKLKEWTPAIIKNTDDNIKSLKSVHDELRTTMKTLYPNRKFIQFNLAD